MEAPGTLPVYVMAASAGFGDVKPVPSIIFLAEYLPGELAAARSDLVIYNGGSPTCYQALAAGVPVIGVFTNLDQYLNMHYLQSDGVGLLLLAG
jgi:UDP:flavonoid glycosyltransferase YjiC (YdhE family)